MIKQIIPKLYNYLQFKHEIVIYNVFVAFSNYIQVYASKENQIALDDSIQIMENMWNYYKQLQPNQFDDFDNIMDFHINISDTEYLSEENFEINLFHLNHN